MKSLPIDRPLVRVTDEGEVPALSASAFASLAREESKVRCLKCKSMIDQPGLDPRGKYLCRRCHFERECKQALQPRMFYASSNHIPFVNMPKPKIDWKTEILSPSK
jgi:hypothetical protein